MVIFTFHRIVLVSALCTLLPLCARNMIVEFKGAYWLPTHSSFKDIYHHGSGLYGVEFTAQLVEKKHWYGFASIDYFQKKGNLPGLCDTSKIMLIPIAIGLKYLIPVSRYVEVYGGLGFQPLYARIKNFLPFIGSTKTQWGYGGIAKLGTYINLSHHFVLDFFIAYNCAHLHSKKSKYVNALVFPKITVSGPVFGAGLGYRF